MAKKEDIDKLDGYSIAIGIVIGLAVAIIIITLVDGSNTPVSNSFLDSVGKDKLGSDNVEFDYTSGDNIYCKNIVVVEGVQLDNSESYVILSDGGK